MESVDAGTLGLVKGTTHDDVLYSLILLECKDAQALKKVEPTLLEQFLRANVLLCFGALGYIQCPLSVVCCDSERPHFVVKALRRNLGKLQLVCANRFPAPIHIDLADLVSSKHPIALSIAKSSSNMWSLIS